VSDFVATYRGDGRFYPGVPARDLTAEDVARLKPDAIAAMQADMKLGDESVYAIEDPSAIPAPPEEPSETDREKE
jgi:hypothetical protein